MLDRVKVGMRLWDTGDNNINGLSFEKVNFVHHMFIKILKSYFCGMIFSNLE